MKLCSDQHAKFEDIAKLIPGRNSKMCYSRFRRLTNKSKDLWTKADNELLKKLVQDDEDVDWKALTKHFPSIFR